MGPLTQSDVLKAALVFFNDLAHCILVELKILVQVLTHRNRIMYWVDVKFRGLCSFESSEPRTMCVGRSSILLESLLSLVDAFSLRLRGLALGTRDVTWA